MKKNRTVITLTPLGLLGQKTYDRLMLYLVKRQLNTVILYDGKLFFSEVEVDPRKKD